MEQAGLLPNPALGQAVDSDGLIDLKYAEATGHYKQPYDPGLAFYFNNGQQISNR